MRRFETQIIRERDAEAHLSAAGLRWVEARYGLHIAGAATFWLGAYFAAIFGVWSLLTTSKAAPVALAEGAGLMCLGAVAMLYRWGTRERALIFHTDRIHLPHGQPRRRRRKTLPIAITDVANIEAWRGGEEFWLLLYTKSADAYVLGRGLNEFQARKVVTLLSHARDDLREALAQPRSDQPRARRVIT